MAGKFFQTYHAFYHIDIKKRNEKILTKKITDVKRIKNNNKKL